MKILSSVNAAQARAIADEFKEKEKGSLEAFLEERLTAGDLKSKNFVDLCKIMLVDRISGLTSLLEDAVTNADADAVMRILGLDPETVYHVWKLFDQRQASKEPRGEKLLVTLKDTFADWFKSQFKWTGLTDGESDFFKVLEGYVTSGCVGTEPNPPDPDFEAGFADAADEFYQLQGASEARQHR